jgi:uncharacterized protein with von Willebrand factor type A (vWA) domain
LVTSRGTESVERLVRFGRELRDAGLPVGSGQILDYCRAVAALRPGDLYWAGRATLVGSREDIVVYDKVFWQFFGSEENAFQRRPRLQQPLPTKTWEIAPVDESTGDSDEPQVGIASSSEILRRKPFAECTEDELRALFAGVSHLLVPTRKSRRYRSVHSGTPDFRRTLRRSFRTAGEPIERVWRTRRRRPRRVVLLLDVSGSMATCSRALLYFGHAGVRTQRNWEVFCFATRLTRVTPFLGGGASHHQAVERAAREVLDWDSGTRIGESLKHFLDEYGHAGLARGSTVVICSDGLEVGDPELIGTQMERLSLLAHRVIWLNPLKEDPRYEPLVRGMRAALPYIDFFASGHNFASLEVLADACLDSREVPVRAGGASAGGLRRSSTRHSRKR